jgi:hypothetical protein
MHEGADAEGRHRIAGGSASRARSADGADQDCRATGTNVATVKE